MSLSHSIGCMVFASGEVCGTGLQKYSRFACLAVLYGVTAVEVKSPLKWYLHY